MLPYINIGIFKLPTYYTAMVLGYLMMVFLMLLKRRREKYRISRLKAIVFATSELIFGILGCKVLFILENINWVKNNGLTLGGFSFYGAAFLIPLAMPLVGKLLKLNFRDTLDCSAVCIIAMLGTIRLGCFLNGCCGGRVLNLGNLYFTLPTQLIECVCDVLILFTFLKYEKDQKYNGLFYPKFLLMYGTARFIIEFFRSTEKDWLYLSHAHWFSIIAIIIGATFEIISKKQIKARSADQLS